MIYKAKIHLVPSASLPLHPTIDVIPQAASIDPDGPRSASFHALIGHRHLGLCVCV